jgi:hypothetical protein
VLAPYLVLLVSNVIVARFVMSNLQTLDGMSVLAAKLITEAAFFLPNFLLQRDVVFRSSAATRSGGTDWTAYYASVPFTARWTRRYTARVLVRALDEAARLAGPIRRIAELGGANSCFLDHVCRSFAPDAYVVVDNNPFGLAQLAGWKPPRHASTTLTVHEADVRSLRAEGDLDTAFSVGLIEHFDRADTRRVLTSHFELVRRGGAVVVSYPTPTWLYRITRRLLEGVRLWRFPDERALTFAEVQSAVGTLGEVVSRRLVWPLVLTQEMVVFRKR